MFFFFTGGRLGRVLQRVPGLLPKSAAETQGPLPTWKYSGTAQAHTSAQVSVLCMTSEMETVINISIYLCNVNKCFMPNNG